MTHSPSTGELANLNKMIGLKRLTKEGCEKYMDEDGRKYRPVTKGGAASAVQVRGCIKSFNVLHAGKN